MNPPLDQTRHEFLLHAVLSLPCSSTKLWEWEENEIAVRLLQSSLPQQAMYLPTGIGCASVDFPKVINESKNLPYPNR